MSVAEFESISLVVLVTGLVLWMAYIVWDLSRRSGAGRFGTMVLFGVLGLGVLGFIIKAVIMEMMDV